VDSAHNPNSGEIRRIGKYDIVGVLGRGGMGVVYRGIDRRLGRDVAVKTLTEGISSDPGMLARFYDEGRKTGSFKHPNIVTVYELGEDNGIPYIVMELVEGDPLEKLICSDGPPPLVECLRIVEELCYALAYAHGHNVIHRDVKPANIFVQPDGRVKLLDFGIARLEEKKNQDLSLTRPGHIIGTVPYMAPERLRDKPLDGRSDIFSAGVVLYQLVSGELPWSGEELALMQRILNDPHPPLSSRCKNCPPALDAIIDRALAKFPDDRYATADDMAGDLATLIAEIRQEQAQQLLPEAKRLIEAQDLPRARAVLQQLLKIQSSHNTEGRELLAEIQRQLNQRQREERIQQIRIQAESFLNNKDLDKCLEILDEGQELDVTNVEFIKLRQRVEKEKEKQKRVTEFLRQADSARREGDYQSAIAFTRKALKVDKSHSKANALFNLLLTEAEEAEKQAEVKAILQSARGELSAGRYKESIELLRKAESLDSNNLELQLLVGDANAGLEQVRRKELVARLECEAAAAAGLDQLQEAARAIREAMANMPTESALVLLIGQVDRQIRDLENRQIVEDTVQTCRDLRPSHALALVQKARQRLPGDERLLALEGLLAERVRQQTAEERRDEYLSQAREALSGGQYAEAVRILEVCEREGIARDEIRSLLEFARREEAEHRREDLLHRRVAQAQSMIADSEFGEAVKFLEQSLEESDEPTLRLLLDQAIEGRESLRKQVEAGLATAAKMARAGRSSEAIHFLQAQPPAVLRSERLQTAISALDEEQQQAVFRMIGRAYTALQTELPAGENTIQWVAAAFGNSPFAVSVTDAFHARMHAFADRTIQDLISRCKIMLRNRDRAGSAELAKQASGVIDYAGSQAQADWRNLVDRTARSGLLTRLRK
jgi:serine/threonine-protein kinase